MNELENEIIGIELENEIVGIEKELSIEISEMRIYIDNANELLDYLLNKPVEEIVNNKRVAGTVKTEYEQAIIDYNSNIDHLILSMKHSMDLLGIYSEKLDRYINTSERDIELLRTIERISQSILMIMGDIRIHWGRARKLNQKLVDPDFIKKSGNINIDSYINDIKSHHDEIRFFLTHFSKFMLDETNTFDKIDTILEGEKEN